MNRNNVMSWRQTSMLSKRGAGAECAFSDKAAFGRQPDGYRGFYFLPSFRRSGRVVATQTENSAMFPYFEFSFIRYSLYPLTRAHTHTRAHDQNTLTAGGCSGCSGSKAGMQTLRGSTPLWEADYLRKQTTSGNGLPGKA